MQTKEMIMEVINSWSYPTGFITEGAVGNTNGVLLVQMIQSDFGGVFTHANLDSAVTKLGDKLAYNVRVVERAPAQSQEQVNTVVREWRRVHAPKDLINNEHNNAILTNYVKSFSAGVFTLASLTDAANNAEGFQRVSAADVQAAREQKERERMAKDFKDSWTPQTERNFSAEVKANVAAEKNRKEQASASADADNVIESYVANHPKLPGRQDFGLTDTRKAEMRAIKAQHKDAIEGLKAVRAKKMSYPG